MSSKLDQSLDEIAGSRRATARRQRTGKPRVSTGGVTKNTAQKAAKPAPPAPRPVPSTGDSKIIVSNLPSDVNEQQIKTAWQADLDSRGAGNDGQMAWSRTLSDGILCLPYKWNKRTQNSETEHQ
ncbi:hypothetical protein BDV97DRAFT_370842 [Delphinella strobiligena]|nr:hypothetical protein BDV97DRAFT_370842 [Delphinella strobiligena]